MSFALFFGGIKSGLYYYPFRYKKDKRWATYVGVKYGISYVAYYDVTLIRSLYVPVGIHYISFRGFNFSIDCGLLSYTKNEAFFKEGTDKQVLFVPNIKIGYRF